MAQPPFTMSKYASELDLLRDKCAWLEREVAEVVAQRDALLKSPPGTGNGNAVALAAELREEVGDIQQGAARYDMGELLTRAADMLDALQRPVAFHSETVELALKIADENALCAIESACACDDWKQPDELRWWMTDVANALADAHVRESVKYLEMRGVLEHHPEHPTWVRWPEDRSPLSLSGTSEADRG